MLRLLGICGMSAAFLFISPPFRASVLNGFGMGTVFLDKYSPYSYLCLAAVLGWAAVSSLATAKPQ